MKLVKCHIENFGKLSDFDFDFVDGLNCIREENGWGKSTFATFIKAMFYGLPSTAKKNLDENERKKYLPWQGGNYGGNLVFAINQKQYKIERFFGKNKTEDTFSLIDLASGKKTKDYTENVGVEIFGLDEEAFERSSYIPQKVLDSNINESIAQRLNHVIHGDTENFNYEKAQEQLNKKRVLLSNNKKTGQIQNLESQIEDVITRMRELESKGQSVVEIKKQVNAKDALIDNLLQEQNGIKQQINTYGQLQERRANQELFATLSRKVATTQNEIKLRQALLNHHQTNLTEIDGYLAQNKTVTTQESAIKLKTDGDYLEQRYQALTDYFGGKIPTTEKTQSIYNAIARYNALKTRADTTVAQKFQAHSRKQQLLCIGFVILAILGVLGGVLTLNVQMPLAITLLVVSGVLILAAGYVYLINLINVKTSTSQNTNDTQLRQDKTEMLRLQKDIAEFLNKYETTTDYLTAINHVIANVHEYENIKTQMALSTNQISELAQIITNEKLKIDKFLAQFNFNNPNQSHEEKLLLLKQTLIELVNLNQRLTSETKELEQFKVAKHFNETETAATIVDIDELQRKERTVQIQIDRERDQKSQAIARINKIQDELAELSDLENEKAILQNKLKDLGQEFFAVKSAMKFLQAANENLSAQFLAPMKNGLRKYLALVTDLEFNNLNLDTDFNISFEEYGQLRDVNYYSRGYQNTINLCMRFALIDRLYQQEKPFIVLDDPFINLDEIKVTKAKQFLQELAKSYQLIYFSCHNSRC